MLSEENFMIASIHRERVETKFLLLKCFQTGFRNVDWALYVEYVTKFLSKFVQIFVLFQFLFCFNFCYFSYFYLIFFNFSFILFKILIIIQVSKHFKRWMIGFSTEFCYLCCLFCFCSNSHRVPFKIKFFKITFD